MTPEFLTATAALLAAALSALSLFFTRRWQQSDLHRGQLLKEAEEARARKWEEFQKAQEAASKNKVWALENLKVALVDHINLSFKIGRICSDAKMARKAKDDDSLLNAFASATAKHIEYMDLMVYLRLFSTPSIVASAERLHQSVDQLLDLTFPDEVRMPGRRPFTKGGSIPDGLTERQVRGYCMDHRESLINHVREYLELPPDAAIDRKV